MTLKGKYNEYVTKVHLTDNEGSTNVLQLIQRDQSTTRVFRKSKMLK